MDHVSIAVGKLSFLIAGTLVLIVRQLPQLMATNPTTTPHASNTFSSGFSSPIDFACTFHIYQSKDKVLTLSIKLKQFSKTWMVYFLWKVTMAHLKEQSFMTMAATSAWTPPRPSSGPPSGGGGTPQHKRTTPAAGGML